MFFQEENRYKVKWSSFNQSGEFFTNSTSVSGARRNTEDYISRMVSGMISTGDVYIQMRGYWEKVSS